jgi:hypothetical protein
MKKVGDKVYTRYRGQVVDEFVVRGIATLPKPVQVKEPVIGEGAFLPAIILLERVRDGLKEIWFPYWKASPATKGKLKYAQFASKYGEAIFLPLLKDAIRQSFFTKDFLKNLAHELDQALSK